MADYSAIFRANGWSKKKILEEKLNISGRFNRKIYEKNKSELGVENIRNQLDQPEKQIWEIPFLFKSFDEDNFDQDDEISETSSDENEEEFRKLTENDPENMKVALLDDRHKQVALVSEPEEWMTEKQKSERHYDAYLADLLERYSGPDYKWDEGRFNRQYQEAIMNTEEPLAITERGEKDNDLNELKTSMIDFEEGELNASEYVPVVHVGEIMKRE